MYTYMYMAFMPLHSTRIHSLWEHPQRIDSWWCVETSLLRNTMQSKKMFKQSGAWYLLVLDVGNPIEMIMGLCRLPIDTHCCFADDDAFDRTWLRSFRAIFWTAFLSYLMPARLVFYMEACDLGTASWDGCGLLGADSVIHHRNNQKYSCCHEH